MKKPNSFLIFMITLGIVSVMTFAAVNIFTPKGLVEANTIRVIGTTIIIGNNCTGIVAETSLERAESIELGLRNLIQIRPNTHDTIVSILRTFNITLDRVEIKGFDGSNYKSDMILSLGDKMLRLDTRPSDAIAIALRTNSTIYLNRTILNQHGTNICL